MLSLTYACGSGETTADDPETMDADPSATISVQDRDSLRDLYHELMAAMDDTLPLNLIREAGKLYPVDEAPKDTAFFIFRQQLIDAIDRRDVFALMDVIHPDIKVSFGGEGGVADFVSTWELETPDKAQNSRVWSILKRVLVNGGIFENGGKTFIAPYIYAVWPDAHDAFEHVAITGSGVRLRSAPNLQSQTLTMVSYDVVKRLETTPKEETIGGETHPWEKVQLLGEEGKEGYIYGKYIASSIDYRAAFERQPDGKWLMNFLVAGD
ncbi:hypothetical protein CRP01_08315 [Flavilitoribacter nigricans DSM 23189 = NBRC 102662]|uniref:SH3 domain-containing protein n=1 Tax=Flavilitoribacter nigricans (strain ATCC 23147 / DSM 23189 / NBRC 102662 / NCIMB 1420 / SS-2) TaxID=1122177 RepID=A0A2D0NFF3_FLAN2|nr:hypothetical protein CRP01_08315 [Flavilitoribacter nigricans DSM 23189 = NBRC 102662]